MAERAKWIKSPKTFDMPQCIIDITKLYTNYKHTGLWDQTVQTQKAQMMALATHLKETYKQAAKKAKPKPSKTPTGTGRPKLGKWVFENVGQSFTGPDGNDYDWCEHHGRMTDGVHSGMYMPAPHDHEQWQANKDTKGYAKKDVMEGRVIPKRKAPANSHGSPENWKANLRLSNSFKSALATQLMTSDTEADVFVDKLMLDALGHVPAEKPPKA